MARNPFERVAVTAPNYSTFDLSHDHKTSLKMGEIVPVTLLEAIPGDTFNLQSEAMFRLMPMVSPIMHKVDIRFMSFFVPNRILWDNWEDFITGGETGQSIATPPAYPTIDIVECLPSSLANYLGVPIIDGSGPEPVKVSALPFAGYQRIYQEWFRDQNLITDTVWQTPIKVTDGNQSFAHTDFLRQMRNAAWEHDYFTSALPYAQKGDAVELPLDFQDAVVKFRNSPDPDERDAYWRDGDTGNILGAPAKNIVSADDGSSEAWDPTGPGKFNAKYDPNGNLIIDGDDLRAITTINDLRTAWALQQFLEKNARGGSRYKETIEVHFNVRSDDQRLQRPEFLGSSKGTVAVSEVLQTSSSDSTTPQGNMAGHGISVMATGGVHYTAKEHGWIYTFVVVLPKTAYFQGLPKQLFKFDRMQHAWPDFAQLGEQEIVNKELYVTGDSVDDNAVFGYIPRYSEYRYCPSRVTGQMADTLLHWHMAREFGTPPQLNGQFVTSNPTTRIFAVEEPGNDTIVAHIFSRITARRPLPVFGIPAPLV